MVNRIKRALFSTYVLKHIILCLRTESDDLTCQVEVLVGEISAINVLCVCVCVCVWHVCVCVWRGSALVCVWCVCGGGALVCSYEEGCSTPHTLRVECNNN